MNMKNRATFLLLLRRFLFLLLLLLLLSSSFDFITVVAASDTTNTITYGWEIGEAIKLWQSNQTEAEEKYGGPMELWDISRVTSMSEAFRGITNFTADLSAWDTSKVTSMSEAFRGIENFSIDLSGWDTSKVTWMDGTFAYSKNISVDVSTWNTAKVINMGHAFAYSVDFSADVSAWDVSRVTGFVGTFAYSHNFSVNVSNWDTSKVTSLHQAFSKSTNFLADVSKWNTSSVIEMGGAFAFSHNFSADVSKWDVSSVTSMYDGGWPDPGIFQGSTNFSSDVSNWNTSKVTDFTRAFFFASWFNAMLCWDLSSANPQTLTRFSCYSQGGFDCNCSVLGTTAAATNSNCLDPTPACVNSSEVGPTQPAITGLEDTAGSESSPQQPNRTVQLPLDASNNGTIDLVHFTLSYGFEHAINGTMREPTEEEILDLVCSTNRFFRDRVQNSTTQHETEVETMAIHIDWEHVEGTAQPFTLQFLSKTTYYNQTMAVPPEVVSQAMEVDVDDILLYVEGYVWKGKLPGSMFMNTTSTSFDYSLGGPAVMNAKLDNASCPESMAIASPTTLPPSPIAVTEPSSAPSLNLVSEMPNSGSTGSSTGGGHIQFMLFGFWLLAVGIPLLTFAW